MPVSEAKKLETQEWITKMGYFNLREFMEDEDYLMTEGGYWVDLDDNKVDPWQVAYDQMKKSEAANR